ncbi:50S ribosomal protein L25 [Candidatus Palibaumannia cicadellinicola]|uniref:Large ribosomal subunit protein bL25 n=1 Tax=Candidatus Palibaumannia cicadellinicola TaxID=186490 RepID=A0A0K2BLJ9_9GAMM|nr:50S ribosomal protein L25 [Candidatus Baumannia cicadellinicola]AKZ65933.1 LSU ribosomal protein L25p [Candidatus Baumannia cicadellinicola]
MLTIYAEPRKYNGTSASRRLRRLNKLPAIIYGSQTTPVAITLDNQIIMHNENKNSFYNDQLALVINGNKIIVKIWSIQRHPFKQKITHIDFIIV